MLSYYLQLQYTDIATCWTYTGHVDYSIPILSYVKTNLADMERSLSPCGIWVKYDEYQFLG